MIDLSYFENKDGLLAHRPETKSVTDLVRVITAGKSQKVLDLFAVKVSVGEQWDWVYDYIYFLNDVVDATAFNNALPVISEVGAEVTVYADPRPMPIAPIRPNVRTIAEVLVPYYALRRAAAYPTFDEYLDAKVKQSSPDADTRAEGKAQEAAYMDKSRKVKKDIPKDA